METWQYDSVQNTRMEKIEMVNHVNHVKLYLVPAGITPSNSYAVTVNGMESFTYLTTGPAEAEFTAGHTASWTSFAFRQFVNNFVG